MIYDSKESAIQALVEQDVARWGEQERSASRAMHSKLSFGQALNKLANRAELADRPDPELRKQAMAALTKAEWRKMERNAYEDHL